MPFASYYRATAQTCIPALSSGDRTLDGGVPTAMASSCKRGETEGSGKHFICDHCLDNVGVHQNFSCNSRVAL